MAKEYFVSKSCIVRMYKYSVAVLGNGPIMSVETLLKAASGCQLISSVACV